MQTSIHSALFVDFDNIFISLRHGYGDDTARKFATSPGRWLDWLSRFDTPELPEGGPEHRRILLRKCYLNPNGGHKDSQGGKGRWIGYGRYRVDFTRAAFEVVDCPSLTRQRKSSTDINMALDIVDALAQQQPSFGEFIILSGDADFTPALLRLRRHDRRVIIVTPDLVSQAYRAVADVVIEAGQFVEQALARKAAPVRESSADVDDKEPRSVDPAKPKAMPESVKEELSVSPQTLVRIDQFIKQYVQYMADGSEAVPIEKLDQAIRSKFRNEKWFGTKHETFKSFLKTRLPDLGLKLAIHENSESIYFPSPPHLIDEMEDPQLHGLAKRIQTVCGVPSFRASVYTKLFDVICEVIRRDGYQLIPVEKAVCDRLGELGWPVSRKHVGWILHGLLSTGCDLGNDKTVAPAVLADTFEFFVLSLVASSGLELTAEELSLVDQWIEPSHRPQESAPKADA